MTDLNATGVLIESFGKQCPASAHLLIGNRAFSANCDQLTAEHPGSQVCQAQGSECDGGMEYCSGPTHVNQPSNSTEVLKSASVDTHHVVQGHRTLLGAELETAQVGINHKASLGQRPSLSLRAKITGKGRKLPSKPRVSGIESTALHYPRPSQGLSLVQSFQRTLLRPGPPLPVATTSRENPGGQAQIPHHLPDPSGQTG